MAESGSFRWVEAWWIKRKGFVGIFRVLVENIPSIGSAVGGDPVIEEGRSLSIGDGTISGGRKGEVTRASRSKSTVYAS